MVFKVIKSPGERIYATFRRKLINMLILFNLEILIGDIDDIADAIIG